MTLATIVLREREHVCTVRACQAVRVCVRAHMSVFCLCVKEGEGQKRDCTIWPAFPLSLSIRTLFLWGINQELFLIAPRFIFALTISSANSWTKACPHSDVGMWNLDCQLIGGAVLIMSTNNTNEVLISPNKFSVCDRVIWIMWQDVVLDHVTGCSTKTLWTEIQFPNTEQDRLETTLQDGLTEHTVGCTHPTKYQASSAYWHVFMLCYGLHNYLYLWSIIGLLTSRATHQPLSKLARHDIWCNGHYYASHTLNYSRRCHCTPHRGTACDSKMQRSAQTSKWNRQPAEPWRLAKCWRSWITYWREP